MSEEKKEKIVEFFNQILNVYNFKIITDINENSENIFRLIDIQKGNLGGIEQEEFSTLADIINRLDIYHRDYIYVPLENKQSSNEILSKDDWDLVAKRYIESNTVEKVLEEIHPEQYADLLSKEEKFEIQDIIKILNEDFLENYKEKEPSKNEIIHSKVKEYFNENRIEDLMDYGNDGDEGLYKLSSLYEEIMDKLNIKYDYVYTEDVSDGKYLTTIIFNNNEKISIDTSARNGKN